jgi:Ca2+-binding RTX toxin-like protein
LESIYNVEHVRGSEFNDVLIGDAGGNALKAGGGNDGKDRISGGAGDALLHGNEGNDWLNGSQDRDKLLGVAGRDILIGGMDGDQLIGGDGADTFVFDSLAETSDILVDFNSSEGDLIQIFAAGFGDGLTAGVLAPDQFGLVLLQ